MGRLPTLNKPLDDWGTDSAIPPTLPTVGIVKTVVFLRDRDDHF